MDNTSLLICIVVCCMVSLNSFLVGYIVGSKNGSLINDNVGSTLFNKSDKRSVKTNTIQNPNISIDDSKFVVSIETDGLEKKYNQLGDVKTSNENITSSIDRLKNLKK